MREEWQVVGPRIKVKVDGRNETKTSSGLIVALGDKEEDNETGIVVQLGTFAYGTFDSNWCDLGDTILFQRYAGKPREEKDKNGNISYFRILKDTDVIAVLKPVEDKTDE